MMFREGEAPAEPHPVLVLISVKGLVPATIARAIIANKVRVSRWMRFGRSLPLPFEDTF